MRGSLAAVALALALLVVGPVSADCGNASASAAPRPSLLPRSPCILDLCRITDSEIKVAAHKGAALKDFFARNRGRRFLLVRYVTQERISFDEVERSFTGIDQLRSRLALLYGLALTDISVGLRKVGQNPTEMPATAGGTTKPAAPVAPQGFHICALC